MGIIVLQAVLCFVVFFGITLTIDHHRKKRDERKGTNVTEETSVKSDVQERREPVGMKVEAYRPYEGYCKGLQEAIAKERVMTYSGGENHYPRVLVDDLPGGSGAFRELWECPFCPEGEDCITARRKKEI